MLKSFTSNLKVETMTPGKSNIYEIFNGTRVFEIPFYQRPYVWGEKQWERMLSDMVDVCHRSKNYFLGAIILKQTSTSTSTMGDHKIVIDGQQRLTTLAIFQKVLALKKGGEELFRRRFVLPDGCFAIAHSHVDREDFQQVMQLTSYSEPIEGNSNIIKAYKYFRENLNPDLIDEMRLNKNVQVIDIVIDDNDDEQQIFDTINSLGVDLTTAELLKNHLFTERTIDKYETLWKPAFERDEECIAFWAQDLLKGRNKRKNIEAFLNAFLQIKVHEPSIKVSSEDKLEYAKSSTLFYSYKDFISKYYSGREFELIEELVHYAKIYQSTFTPAVVDESLTFEPSIDRINFLIFVADNTTMIPYIMFIIKNVNDKNERVKIYDYLESYIVRRLICRKSTKNYSDLFSENLINANIQTADALRAYIQEKDSTNSLAMPSDAEVVHNFLETEQPNYRALSILYLLESRLRNNRLLTTQLMKYNVYTLEHLMPQKWITNWPLPIGGDSERRIHLVRTMGNCTMITQALNSTISNDCWSVKLEGRNNRGGLKTYASGLFTLDGVLTLDAWNENCIINRSTQLAELACQIWKF